MIAGSFDSLLWERRRASAQPSSIVWERRPDRSQQRLATVFPHRTAGYTQFDGPRQSKIDSEWLFLSVGTGWPRGATSVGPRFDRAGNRALRGQRTIDARIVGRFRRAGLARFH